jgi:aldehyde:ferredoxin oxidoreductase
MDYYGYMGKVLHVDLTTGEIREEDLDLDLARDYIGDWGIGARLAYDLIKPHIDALSAENYIIIGAGPLCGTICPSSARVHLWTKFPVTNTIGPAGGPLGFGSRLKYAGYDELVITGRSENPVYLEITDEGVEIRDAGDLWGKDIYKATDMLWQRHGRDHGVLCIGPAGENLVKISLAIIDKGGTVGRHGLGAVMGFKQLKAIVIGGGQNVKIHDEAAFNDITDQVLNDVMNWPELDEYVHIGHMEYDFEALARLTTRKYYSEITDIEAIRDTLGPDYYVKHVKKARLGCPSCPIACRAIEQVRIGEHQGIITCQAHTVHFLAEHLDVKSLEDITTYAHYCNIYGVDYLSLTTSSEFILDLHKRGIVSKDDLEGLEVGYGQGFIELVKKVAYRKGVGDVLADSLAGFIRRFGPQCIEYGYYIKGADPYFDPRPTGLGVMQLALVLGPHMFGNSKQGMLNPGKFNPNAGLDEFRKYGEWIAVPPESLERIFNTPLKFNVARFLKHSEELYATFCSLGICMRYHIHQFFGMQKLAQYYTAATGLEISARELKIAAERSWNVLKALNVREGFSRKDDCFPRKWLEPIKRGDEDVYIQDIFKTRVLTKEDLEQLQDDYYDERGWDLERGIPTRAKLLELGLSDIADDLDKQGFHLA